jgi:outer membrane protein TolC
VSLLLVLASLALAQDVPTDVPPSGGEADPPSGGEAVPRSGGERPLRYADALAAAARANPAAVRGDYVRRRAEAAELSARGIFDPVATLSATTAYFAFEDVRDALPIAGNDRTWDVLTWVAGVAPTGTSYLIEAGVGYDRSFATGLQPVYDDNGDQIGTGPYEAKLSAYGSNVRATISQELLRGLQISYNAQTVLLARQAGTTADLMAEQLRQQAMADAALAYWTWVTLYETHRIDRAAVIAADESVRVSTAQVEARQLAPVEGMRFESALVLARAAALDSGVLAAQARDLLLLTMGEEPGQDVIPATESGDPPAITIALDAAVTVAMEQNLEIAVARAGIETQTLVRKAARHARLPTLQATASAGSTTGNQPRLGAAVSGVAGEPAQPNVSVGALFSVPLGNRAAVGLSRMAEYDLLSAESLTLETERFVRARVAFQLSRMAAAQERIPLADTNVRLAEQTVAAMDALVLANRAITRDVLDARTLLDRSRVEAVRARTEWRLAHTELLRLQARLTETLP